MTIKMKKIISAVLFRPEFIETYLLFRKLGANWLEASKNAVACMALVA